MSSLADYLIAKQLIDTTILQKAQQAAEQQKQSLLCYLAAHQLVSAYDLVQVIAELYHLPIIELQDYSLENLLVNLLPLELMQKTNVIPLREEETVIEVAMADPSDFNTLELIKFYLQKPLQIKLVRYDQIQKIINQITIEQQKKSLIKSSNDVPINSVMESQANFYSQAEEPMIVFINHILVSAIQQKVSDIHFEPYESNCRVRFRQDGLLREVNQLASHLTPRLAARLKIMANLDIAEHRLPQDGHFKLKTEQEEIDVRLNTCPTLYGEKIVLRLLRSGNLLRDVTALDLLPTQYKDFLAAIKKPQGLILVTGPTGSGKTATLYAALQYLNTIEKNISTVEDPVEINLPGINQVNIAQKIGLTFANVLRAFLRQDPDIIMVGEIRDLETAEIALKAAQTGHLVLSTLHTNSALEAITRLYNMGIAPYNIASSIILITAQRLLRKLCSGCKQVYLPNAAEQKEFKLAAEVQLYHPGQCQNCHEGYLGRFAVHEVLLFDEAMRQFALQPNEYKDLFNYIQQQHILTLRQASLECLTQGITSSAEIYRVLG